jgi:hypothetical protein
VPASKFPFVTESGELNLALTTLSDVGLTAPASGESLVYNGSSWANTVITGYTTEEAQDAVGGILTDTSSISFSYNDGTPSISASVKNSGITDVMISGGIDATKIGSGSVSSAEFGYLDGVTSSLQVQLDSKYASANPSGFISAASVASAYQPLDADLTSIASTGVDPYGIGLLTKTSGSGVRDYIGAGTSSFDGAYGSLSGTPSTFAPSSHTHGNITNAGAIGSTTGLPIITTASGVLTVGSFGTTSGTFAAGDDSRITGALSSATAATTYLPLAGGTLTGDLLFTDATYDIGKSGATRPRDGFFSRNLTVGGTSTFSGGGYVPNTTSLAFQCISPFQASTASIYGTYCSIGNGVGLGFSSAAVPMAKLGYGAGTVSFELLGTAAIGSNGYGCKLIGSSIEFAVGTFLSNTTGLSLSSVGLYGTGNTLKIVNSTNAQTLDLHNTYTSATSLETFRIKANAAAAYQIGSAIGSAGGDNRVISLGHWNSGGTFTSALSIDTAGAATFASTINTMDFVVTNYNLGVGYSTSPSLAFAATALGWTARSTHNYAISIGASSASSAANQFTVGDSTNVSKFRFGTGVASVTFDNPLILGQLVSTSGSPTAFTLTGATHTTLTASTECTDVNFNLARTVQFATGALTTQRAMRIQAPTYSFVGGSTITTASTLSISGPPVAGTNATITNAYALNVESGKIRAVGGLVVGTTDGFNNSLDIGNGLVQAWASGYSCLVMNFGGNPLSYHANWGLGGIQLQDRSAGFGWSSLSNNLTNFDAAFYSPAANIIEQRRTTNAQTFRVYSTYTSSTAYELINIKGKASANFEIGPENGSAGGTLRGLTLGCYPAGTATIVGWAQFRPNTSTGVLEAFYLGPIADSTATGGNARGTNAVDLQILRTGAGQVASGAGSFLAGRRGTASGGGSFCFGDDSAATGQFAVAIGCFANATSYGTLAIGINAAASGSQSICISNGNVGSSATAQDAIAVGNRALADRTGIVAIANGGFAANGDAQKVLVALRNKTTDATPVTLYSNGSSTRLTITSGKILYADVLISGIKSDGSAAACYKRKVAIKNVGGTTSLVGTVEAIGTDIEDNASTDVAITADNTNDALDISVTGIAAETWRWVCVVEGLEIAYGT